MTDLPRHRHRHRHRHRSAWPVAALPPALAPHTCTYTYTYTYTCATCLTPHPPHSSLFTIYSPLTLLLLILEGRQVNVYEVQHLRSVHTLDETDGRAEAIDCCEWETSILVQVYLRVGWKGGLYAG